MTAPNAPSGREQAAASGAYSTVAETEPLHPTFPVNDEERLVVVATVLASLAAGERAIDQAFDSLRGSRGALTGMHQYDLVGHLTTARSELLRARRIGDDVLDSCLPPSCTGSPDCGADQHRPGCASPDGAGR